jgi:hypothetical protein
MVLPDRPCSGSCIGPDAVVYARHTYEQEDFICDMPGKLVTHQGVDCLAGVSATYLALTDAHLSIDSTQACFNVSRSFT